MSYSQTLRRIGDRSAVVAIVGLGYVGLPLAEAFASSGFTTLGLDVDAELVLELKQGAARLGPEAAVVERLTASRNFSPTTDPQRLAEADAILVAVPTPLGPHNDPDLRHVTASAATIGAALRPGQLVVLESTTFPGTTRTIFLDALESARTNSLSTTVGVDFFVAYSPERENPGSDIPVTSVPKLVGGLDQRSTELALALYRQVFDEVYETSSAEVAEAAKLLENIFRAVNIALVNEMKVVLAALDIDVWEVIAAASTKPYGYMPFYPGPGLGGHCIPIDPFYLSWVAKEVGVTSNFIELAGVTNTRMPDYVVQRVTDALNDDERSVRGAHVLVLGLAYKRDVADLRESPACRLIERLCELGASISYHDPFIPHYTSRAHPTERLSSVVLDAAHIESADVVLVATDHSAVDYALIAQNARVIVDTRNVIRRSGLEITGRLYSA